MGMESKECHAEMEKKERSERESGGGGNDLEEIHEICSPLISPLGNFIEIEWGGQSADFSLNASSAISFLCEF